MMLKRLGSALIFVAGSVVGGLALAFLIIALRPDLIRGPNRSPGPAALPAGTQALPAALRVTYAAAVQRAAPAVVNIYTARLVTERVAPTLGELFGDYMPH
jgi:S1-C subfamily serine protease